MHPSHCPEWEYELLHQDFEAILIQAGADILLRLTSKQIGIDACLRDTRPIHAELFKDLVPAGYEYFAGHYRGENFECLKYYGVKINSDPRVGHEPSTVIAEMLRLANKIDAGLLAMDQLFVSIEPAPFKLLKLVEFACAVFELFLRIHPYANGNGHIGRFIVWCVLGRYNYWPKHWHLEPRPLDPHYTAYIKAFRDGDRAPLMLLVMACLN